MLKSLYRKAIGSRAENDALLYLQEQGLKFVEKNFHCRQGEIDLVFKDNDTLVFVEVRYRKSSKYGHAYETVNKRKQQKIISTARYYLHKHRLTESVCSRFDVISIEKSHSDKKNDTSQASTTLQWFKNAFSDEA